MSTQGSPHLGADEMELWADGLLPAARSLHLADCSRCLASAERERQLFLALARLERFSPSAGFADRIMGMVRIPEAAARRPRT